jgi:hypothetical protein
MDQPASHYDGRINKRRENRIAKRKRKTISESTSIKPY